MKREIPLAITFIAGLVMMIQFYSPRVDYAGGIFGSRGVGDTFLSWFNIISVFAFILGVASMLAVNGSKIIKNQPGWGYNLLLIASFAITLFLGVYKRGATGQGTPFYWIFEYVYGPLQSTMYALLAFFIASAAFRAFKAKTVEATLMLVTAFIVMLGRVPIGEQMWDGFFGFLHLDVMSINTLIDKWIMGSFNTAGQRAILLGASVGAISVSLKILLGIERSYLGGD